MTLTNLQTALALRGIGYDGDCSKYINRRTGQVRYWPGVRMIPCPTLEQAAAWLRDQGIYVWVVPALHGKGVKFCGRLREAIQGRYINVGRYDTYDAALECLIAKAAEIIAARQDQQ